MLFKKLKARIAKSKLTKSKTVWVGIGISVYGAILAINGNTEEGIKTLTEGLALIFLRQGIEKQK